MAITASDVAKLRKMTGAGMMDCKKALQEAEGDFDQATDILRKKGQKVAQKRAGREATEGVVYTKVSEDNKTGVIISLNCETDFVAKSDDFLQAADTILDTAISTVPASLDEMKNQDVGGQTVNDLIVDKTGIIGEKIELGYYNYLEAADVAHYIHSDKKLAAIVGFNKSNVDEEVKKNIAMQVAAMNPVAIDKDGVPQETVDHELELGKEQARQDGKPENILDKIAQGRLNKFYDENTLLNQESIKYSKKTIRQYLEEYDKELTVTDFKRYSLKG